MKGEQRPTLQEEVIYRPEDQLSLFDKLVVDSIVPCISNDVACAPFRKFGLYVYLDSTSTPDVIHIEVEFLDPWTGQWYTHKQGVFAALYWEDTDTASGIYECFVGDVVGRSMRVRITGIDVAASGNVFSATKYFTTSIAVDFWN